MTGIADVGEVLVGRLAGRLGCASHQLALWRRGLSWHPAGLTQHIWAEEVAHAGTVTWRLHAWTWCLKRVVASSHEMVGAIAAELPRNAMSGLVRKPGSPSRLGLAASTLVGENRVEWAAQVMAAVALLQVRDAIRLTRSPAVLTAGASPDLTTTGRPVEWHDRTPMPGPPEFGEPSLGLDSLPFSEIADLLRRHDGVRAIATLGGVTASFPFTVDGDRHDFIVLEMRLGARHGLGHGVWVSMSIPTAGPAHLLHALALNEAEIGGTSPTNLLGGWIVRGAQLLHDAFVPWSLCGADLVRHLADSAARRALWLREAWPSVVPDEWPDTVPGRVLPFRRRG